jgi:hypothetical protein
MKSGLMKKKAEDQAGEIDLTPMLPPCAREVAPRSIVTKQRTAERNHRMTLISDR